MTTANITKSNAEQPTKAGQLEKLLKTVKGASLEEMVLATGWQSHSCRAFLTGLRKKGHNVVRAKLKDDTTFYRIAKVKATDQALEQTKPETVEKREREAA